MTDDEFPPGWYEDPTAPGEGRYWNGTTWTEAVSRGGATVNLPIDPAIAEIPPVPGTQMSIPPIAAAAPTTGTGGSNRSRVGIIVGALVVVVVAALIFALANNDSSDSPTPGTDAPPASGAPSPTAGDG